MAEDHADMYIQVRPSRERGYADHGWLRSFHTFSFADYHDSRHMGFRALRVINEDKVAPNEGFGTHAHQNMEILSYIIDGELKHQDSMGHESIIRPGEVQKISAGTGIRHSEFNPSSTKGVHFLQIWILPEEHGIKPSYQQYSLPSPDPNDPILLIGSPEGGDNIVGFHQDVYVFRGVLADGQTASYVIKPGRGVWLQMIKGQMQLNGHLLKSGDGAAVEQLNAVDLKAQKSAEFLLFDLK